MMGYYAQKLSGARLQRCYELASERVRRYLDLGLDTVVSGGDRGKDG